MPCSSWRPRHQVTIEFNGDGHGARDLYDAATAEPVTINGREWSSVKTVPGGDAPVRCLTTKVAGDTLGICYVNSPQNDDPDQLRTFAAGMTLAASADPSTWYPKAQALG